MYRFAGKMNRLNKSPIQLAGLILVLLISACVSQPQIKLNTQNHKMVDFSGSWELDYGLSDNLEEQFYFQQLLARSEYNRRADSSRGRPVIGSGSRGNLRALFGLGQFTDSISRTLVLEIKQSEEEIEITREDDFPLTCGFYGGSAQPIEQAIGSELCGWDEHQLVFSMILPDGVNIRHRLTLSPEGEKLNVATTVRSRRSNKPFTLNRVYERFDTVEEEFECKQTLANGKSCRRISQ